MVRVIAFGLEAPAKISASWGVANASSLLVAAGCWQSDGPAGSHAFAFLTVEEDLPGTELRGRLPLILSHDE